MRHFYGVEYLHKSVKSFVIFYQLFHSAEETFLKLFNNPDKTCKKNYFIETFAVLEHIYQKKLSMKAIVET